jgi:TolA-binding protein
MFEGWLKPYFWNRHHIPFVLKFVPFCISLAFILSCAYFNTVYNAKTYFHEGKKLVKHDTLTVDSDNFDKAIEKSTSIIVKYPNTRWVDDALFMMGASYYYKGDYSRSLEKLNFLIQNYPASGYYYEAQYLIGLANYKMQKYGSAIVALKEALDSGRFKKRATIAMLYVYYHDDNYSALYETTEALMQGSLSYEERRTVLRFMGMAQFSEKLYADALDTFTQLLDITRGEKDRKELKLRVAEIYLEIDEYDLCRELLVGEVAPEFKDLLGELYMELGKTKEAKEICVELAMGNPGEIAAEAYYELAQILESQDSVELAVAFYDSAMIKSPNSEYGLNARKRSDVLKRVQTLTDETEDVVKAKFLLAEIYFADLEDLPKAIEGYKEVYNEYPDNEWAPKALYAHLYIARNVQHDDTLTLILARDIISSYPRTEYAMSAQLILDQLHDEVETENPD